MYKPDEMVRYRVGRLSLALPKNFARTDHMSRFHKRDISEVPWPAAPSREEAREVLWRQRLAKIADIRPPQSAKEALLEVRDLQVNGRWARAAVYYRNVTGMSVGWTLLLDGDEVAVWFEASDRKEESELLLRGSLELARAYRTAAEVAESNEDWFYLWHGALGLPFADKPERVHAIFAEDKLGIDYLELKSETFWDKKTPGLLERVTAGLAHFLIPGLSMKRLRGRKRMLAGMAGEEALVRMKEEGETNLYFQWFYQGELGSGHKPEITIELEAADEHRDEVIALWDAVLETVQPAVR